MIKDLFELSVILEGVLPLPGLIREYVDPERLVLGWGAIHYPDVISIHLTIGPDGSYFWEQKLAHETGNWSLLEVDQAGALSALKTYRWWQTSFCQARGSFGAEHVKPYIFLPLFRATT